MVRQLSDGPPPAYIGRDRKRVRFVEVANEWLSVSPTTGGTRKSYETILKFQILPNLGGVPVSDLTKIRLQQYVQQSASAPETIRKALFLIRSILEHAVERRLISHNPATKVRGPKVERLQLRVWTADQVTLFLNAFSPETFKWKVLAEVLLFAGLRFGEAIALTPAQVTAETIIVDRAWDSIMRRVKTPKSGKARSVDLHPQLKRDLFTYPEQSSIPRDGLLFPANNGKYLLNSRFLQDIWKPMIERAGVPPIRIHDARHTFVAHLLESGENPVYVKEQAGHYSAGFTLDRYGHLVRSRNRDRSSGVQASLDRAKN